MILFKHAQRQREYAKLDPRLRQIVMWMEHEAWVDFDVLVVTSMFREKHGSVHRYGRGIDIAMLEYGDSEAMRTKLNEKFPYDKNRPEMETVPELRHGTAPHFHIQCKP